MTVTVPSPSVATDVRPRAVAGSTFVLATTGFACLVLLWASSSAGTNVLGALVGLGLLLLAGCGWLVSVGIAVVDRIRHRPPPRVVPLLVAAAVVAASLGLIGVRAPLRARFLVARPDLDAIADQAVDGLDVDETRTLDHSGGVRTFRVVSAYQQSDAVIIEVRGGFIDDVGFAHLPDGPFPELENGSFERPQFRSLGDDWYTWTASW